MDTRIPLTVLGGWLGAGKTTMVNRLLHAATERIAVIVNDVGEVNVDAQLIRDASTAAGASALDDVIELTNGCVCCKVGDDLFATVAELTRRSPTPGRIVLEASGVADLRPIASFVDHPGITIDAIIALAEGANFAYRSSGPPYGSLMRAQLAGADLVIATKLDLVDDDQREPSLEELRQFTKAPVIAASDDPVWLNSVVLGSHQSQDRSTDEDHTADVATAVWRPSGTVPLAKVRHALVNSDLVRAKGSVATAGSDRVVIHLAGHRVTVTDTAGEVPNGVVLIGTASAVDDALANLRLLEVE